MDQSHFLELTSYIGIVLVIFLVVFLLTVKTQNRFSNWLLALFLFLCAIDACKFIIKDVPLHLLSFQAFRWTLVYLVPASFYLYVSSVCFENFRFKPKHLLHAIPFIALNLYYLIEIYLRNSAIKLQFINGINREPVMHFFYLLFEVLFQVYFITSFRLIKRSKTVYLENYADPNNYLLNALHKITILYYALHFIVLLRWLVIFTIGSSEFIKWIITIDSFAFLFCTSWYLFVALHKPEFFRGVNSKLESIKETLPIEKPSAAISEEKQQQMESLRVFMQTKEPYLNSSLTIQDLAEKIKMPVKDLSTLINLYMDKHFFDFINEYRIEKAKELLRDPFQKKLTILEILYKVGFNSKSSFSTSFKKHTGTTPTAFRNSPL
ncbi:MAG: helix-turn-helix domain-containing protein [Pedobacter sp.]|nr:MAG: helix-turn-helix domain-containing protein [Pedobacter sp.]